MSVQLMILGKPGSAVDVYVPIASQETYREVVVPAAVALKLTWLPLFETGCPVPSEDMEEVIGEFERVRKAITYTESLQSLDDRFERVIKTLREYANRNDVEVWIG